MAAAGNDQSLRVERCMDGWQVTLCDPIWHVISRGGVMLLITNCYIGLLTYDCDAVATVGEEEGRTCTDCEPVPV